MPECGMGARDKQSRGRGCDNDVDKDVRQQSRRYYPGASTSVNRHKEQARNFRNERASSCGPWSKRWVKSRYQLFRTHLKVKIAMTRNKYRVVLDQSRVVQDFFQKECRGWIGMKKGGNRGSELTLDTRFPLLFPHQCWCSGFPSLSGRALDRLVFG